MGRDQSRDLRRHSSSFAYHVTSLWRPPSCFAAMLFCIDTITRWHCGARSKVKGYRPFALIQLPVRVRVSNPNERSKVTDLLYSYNYQLGLKVSPTNIHGVFATEILPMVVGNALATCSVLGIYLSDPCYGLVGPEVPLGIRSPTFCTNTITS